MFEWNPTQPKYIPSRCIYLFPMCPDWYSDGWKTLQSKNSIHVSTIYSVSPCQSPCFALIFCSIFQISTYQCKHDPSSSISYESKNQPPSGSRTSATFAWSRSSSSRTILGNSGWLSTWSTLPGSKWMKVDDKSNLKFLQRVLLEDLRVEEALQLTAKKVTKKTCWDYISLE